VADDAPRSGGSISSSPADDTEHEIVTAMRTIWERMKIVIEPSSAVAVAPLLRQEFADEGLRIGVIISGGNVDLESFFAALPAQAAA
jgi:threonine dehydratase